MAGGMIFADMQEGLHPTWRVPVSRNFASDRCQSTASYNSVPNICNISLCRKVNIINPNRLQITDSTLISNYTLCLGCTFNIVTLNKKLTRFSHRWARHFRFRIKS